MLVGERQSDLWRVTTATRVRPHEHVLKSTVKTRSDETGPVVAGVDGWVPHEGQSEPAITRRANFRRPQRLLLVPLHSVGVGMEHLFQSGRYVVAQRGHRHNTLAGLVSLCRTVKERGLLHFYRG